MNINIDFNCTTSTATNYINKLISCGAIPVITIPTKVTSETSSIIDRILTNDMSPIITPGVIETDLVSDHYPIFCRVDYAIKVIPIQHSFIEIIQILIPYNFEMN